MENSNVRFTTPDPNESKYCPLHNIHHYREICPMCIIPEKEGYKTLFTKEGVPYLVPLSPDEKILTPPRIIYHRLKK